MFENIKAEAELSFDDEKAPEEKTPASSPDETKTTSEAEETVSEDAKTPEAEDEGKKADENVDRLDKHSRFKELIAERNEAKDGKEKAEGQLQEALDEFRKEIAELKRTDPKDEPEFETLEDLTKYLKTMPKQIVEQVLDEIEQKDLVKQKESQDIKDVVDKKISALRDAGRKFDENKLLKFAYEHELLNLDKALDLMEELESKKEEKKEEIDKRKKDSALKTAKGGSSEGSVYKPGATLDDVFEQAKKGLS